MSERIVVLFALEREAAPFRRLARDLKHVSIHVSGVGRERARRATEAALCQDPLPDLVIAAGYCGSLSSHFSVGSVPPIASVHDEVHNRWPCRDIDTSYANLLTVDRLIADPTEKHALAERTGCHLVDMESAAVAAVCEARGVPFLAVRAVSDGVDTALSPRLVKLLRGGNVSPLRAALAVLRQPSIMCEFWRLARDTKHAALRLAERLFEITASEVELSR